MYDQMALSVDSPMEWNSIRLHFSPNSFSILYLFLDQNGTKTISF